MATDSLAVTISKLKATRDGYLTALANDALNPQADYSLEGQSVSRVNWRTSLLQNLEQVEDLLLKYEPYNFNTVEM